MTVIRLWAWSRITNRPLPCKNWLLRGSTSENGANRESRELRELVMDLISIKRFFIYYCPDKSECTMNPLGYYWHVAACHSEVGNHGMHHGLLSYWHEAKPVILSAAKNLLKSSNGRKGFFITLRFIQNDSQPYVNSMKSWESGRNEESLTSGAALEGIASLSCSQARSQWQDWESHQLTGEHHRQHKQWFSNNE